MTKIKCGGCGGDYYTTTEQCDTEECSWTQYDQAKKQTLDLEPLCIDLVPIYLDQIKTDKNTEGLEKEFLKIAKIADTVRQAQKKKEKLVFDFRKDVKSEDKKLVLQIIGLVQATKGTTQDLKESILEMIN